jgi:nucleoside-diphosphate-sugar epimerase
MILITGSKGFVGKNLIERLKPNHKIWEFNRGDDLNLTDIETVIHLACDADSRKSNRSVEKSVEDNTGIFSKVLEESTNRNVRRFIYVSSVEAETEHNVYAICKATNEKILKVVAKEYGIEYVIIRPCNLYGPYMDMSDTNRNVVANFMRSIKEGKPMNVMGNKSYPFTYVKSLIDTIEESLTQYAGQTITVGSGLYISIPQLANLLQGITTTWDWVKSV